MRETLIVGGGVMGLLTALHLHDRGRQVCLVDAGSAIPPASWAGGGILSALFPWRYPDPLTRLTHHAHDDYIRLSARIRAAGGVDPQVHRTGMLVSCRGDGDKALSWARKWGVAMYRPGEAGIPPGLRADNHVWMPEVGTIRNPRLLQGLRHLLQKEGVKQLEGQVQSIIRHAGGWRLTGSGLELYSDQVLLSAGAWANSLLAEMDVELSLMPVRGEMLLYDAGLQPPPCIILEESGYVIPRADGKVLVGSTLDPDITDQRPTEKAARNLEAVARWLWPPLQGKVPLAHWAGIRPGSSRPWPWLGEVPGGSGLFVAAGHYRNGLVSAPASAELLADLMCGRTPSLDPEPYSVSSSSPP